MYKRGWIGYHAVLTFAEMGSVTVFFREDVGHVSFAFNVADFDEFFLYFFSYSVVAELDVFESLGSHVFGPLDGGGIIIVDCDGAFLEKVEYI